MEKLVFELKRTGIPGGDDAFLRIYRKEETKGFAIESAHTLNCYSEFTMKFYITEAERCAIVSALITTENNFLDFTR